MIDDPVVGSHPNVAGIMLFGEAPNRHVGGAVIDAAAISAREMSVANVTEERLLSGPAVRLEGANGQLRDPGLIETALDFIARTSARWHGISGAMRSELGKFPTNVVREAIVNAVVHRDYTLSSSTVVS